MKKRNGDKVRTQNIDWVSPLVLDVVCGMEIDEKTAKWKSEYKGKTYYFCGPMCKLEFDGNPQKYVTTDDVKLGK